MFIVEDSILELHEDWDFESSISFFFVSFLRFSLAFQGLFTSHDMRQSFLFILYAYGSWFRAYSSNIHYFIFNVSLSVMISLISFFSP